uniref:DEAD/DEAH box helicase n=1 Tax=Eubacterium cellulosolvens TaxID=29322 RepID=UPI001A99EBBB|nr:DEAD/DEAH box helicase [[Eubacterium] cellulosolvens]
MGEDVFNVLITEYGYEADVVNELVLSKDQKALFDLFQKDRRRFLYELAFTDIIKASASLEFLKYLSGRFLHRVIESEGINFSEITVEPIKPYEIDELLPYVPFIAGKEYVTDQWIKKQSEIFYEYYVKEATAFAGTQREFLVEKGINITIPSRIYFHLVENKEKDKYPFAFLASYTASRGGRIVHFPLKNAIEEFRSNKDELNRLIAGITLASKESVFAARYVESGDIYFPIKMGEKEAYAFLKEVPIFEKCGIVCRIPKWYTETKSTVLVDFSEKELFTLRYLCKNRINRFTPKLIYHGVELTVDEARRFLQRNEGLEIIKGRWIENNHKDLEQLLKEYEDLAADGTTLLEILKTKAGIGKVPGNTIPNVEFSRNDWLDFLLSRAYEEVTGDFAKNRLDSILRPYQKDAFSWLWGMARLGFGACLADDMGLGKTIEVLSFLSKFKDENPEGHVLIIVPATLIANWKSEVDKFTPDIDVFVLRGNNAPGSDEYGGFITIATYQTATRSEYISQVKWDVVILDEAQAIKNYYTSQARKVKSLESDIRIAMTGTPIENNVLELWSIFDFLNPGLLGSREEFKTMYMQENAHRRIKSLIQPFVLRRVKTDKNIISDLPQKNEIDVSINLTKEQIVLYRKAVEDMNAAIAKTKSKQEEQIIVLSSVMKLKQICNHPSQYYGREDYEPEVSGKFIALRDICETIYDKREKVLVFTQFKEIIPALDELLKAVFKKKGATIDGDTSMKRREEYVNAFQDGEYPYMILSLKTAGVGLNLTAATNVIHFDRWWNPAVENQATDRTYRIGQKHNVNVFKFISANTIEEVIDCMLKDKQSVADMYVNDIDTNVLLKLSPDELKKAVAYGGDEGE